MRVTVLYFASLRDAAGCASEIVDVESMPLRELYDGLKARHGFALPATRLRVARNDAFADWNVEAQEGDAIAFIPPVSGG
ncbi:MAG: MoaD/ThiS family protein [Lysobacteraceae bacterium]